MQLPWDEHFFEIIIPAWRAYREAEQRLTEAVLSKDEQQIARTKYDALREGGAASFYVHHFGEVALRAKPQWLPHEISKPREVMNWLTNRCTMLRTEAQTDDVSLLGDVADALKHAILTHRLDARQVSSSDAVMVVGRGYGTGRYGEGKYGGVDEVWILAKSGNRSLSSILQNVIDAWRRAAGVTLPAIGDD